MGKPSSQPRLLEAPKRASNFAKHSQIILLLNVDIARLELLQEQLHIRLNMKEMLNLMVIFAVVLAIGTASRIKNGSMHYLPIK